MGEAFPLRENASQSGFDCWADTASTVFPNGVLEIEAPKAGCDPVRSRARLLVCPRSGKAHELYRMRTGVFASSGIETRKDFLNTGATDFYRLDRAAIAFDGRSLGDHSRVLDWGCGCGRVARFFPADRAASFTGCDIDHDNVAWCRANLPGTFVPSTLRPPLPFSSQFDFDLRHFRLHPLARGASVALAKQSFREWPLDGALPS